MGKLLRSVSLHGLNVTLTQDIMQSDVEFEGIIQDVNGQRDWLPAEQISGISVYESNTIRGLPKGQKINVINNIGGQGEALGELTMRDVEKSFRTLLAKSNDQKNYLDFSPPQ